MPVPGLFAELVGLGAEWLLDKVLAGSPIPEDTKKLLQQRKELALPSFWGPAGEIYRFPERWEYEMGFLSSLVKGVKSITSPITKAIGGIFPATTPIGAAARALSPSIGKIAVPAAAAGAGVLAGAAGYAALSGDGEGAMATPGGNGRFVTVTTVSTIDLVSGQTVRQKLLQGSPYLMNRDLMVAKRVFRTANKLAARMPRKVVHPSKMKMLTEGIIDNAMDSVLRASACAVK